MSDPLVVFLVWHGAGPEALRRFIDSYRRHNAGMEHRLLLVFKEFPEGASREAYLDLLGDVHHERLDMPGTVLDIPAYYQIAAMRQERYLCFFNSQAEILAPRWLALLHAHAADPTVGVVGATGSWESHLTRALTHLRAEAAQKHILTTDEQLRQKLPPFFTAFRAFPNAHVRTNGFMITRERFLSLPFRPGNDKGYCYYFESGEQGMTQHLLRQNLRTVVVGRDGTAYDPRQWDASRTFRSGEQENLLIGDAHTRGYLAAEEKELAAWLRFNAWGRP